MNERQTVIDRYLAHRSRTNRDAVIAAHMYLCKRGARKFRRTGSDPADLEQVAAIGLVKATGAYRAERLTPFEPYAWIVIVGELMHYVRDSEHAIRVPRWLRSLDRRYVAAWETLACRLQTEPSLQQLAAALGVGIEMVEHVQAMRRGLVSEIDARGTSRFEGQLPSRNDLGLEQRSILRIAVDELSERERVIVLGTFGAGLSQSEVAAKLGLSQSQVSKLLARALGKLSQSVA